jgi:hypothetical protein
LVGQGTPVQKVVPEKEAELNEKSI